MVPNASEDLPDPDTPVNTASALRGMATSMSRRLFSRAPRTRTQLSGACGLVPFVLMGVQLTYPSAKSTTSRPSRGRIGPAAANARTSRQACGVVTQGLDLDRGVVLMS